MVDPMHVMSSRSRLFFLRRVTWWLTQLDQPAQPGQPVFLNLDPLFGRQPNRALNESLFLRDLGTAPWVFGLGCHGAHCIRENESQKLLALRQLLNHNNYIVYESQKLAV